MPHIVLISLVGTSAGVLGTSLGGLLSLTVRKPRNTMIGAMLAISGGIMLTVVFKDLVPEALALGGLISTLVGVILGVGLMVLLDIVLPHSPAETQENSPSARLLRTSLLLGVGIAMHNLPEGLAIGAGYSASQSLGLGIALVIALHNIPEGLAMAGPMRAAGVRALHIVGWTALAGAPMGVGAYVGAAMGGVSPLFLSTSLGFAAGAMLYIIFNQLLPDAKRLAATRPAALATAAGVVMGLAILKLVHHLPWA